MLLRSNANVKLLRSNANVKLLDVNLALTQLRKRKIHKDLSHKIKAIDALYEGMVFHRDTGPEIVRLILLALGNSRADLAANLKKQLNDHMEKFGDFAAKLAPYQSPRLESIETKNTTIHKFVIGARAKPQSTDSWLTQVEQEKKLLPPIVVKEDTIKESLQNIRGYDPDKNNNNIEDFERIEVEEEINDHMGYR